MTERDHDSEDRIEEDRYEAEQSADGDYVAGPGVDGEDLAELGSVDIETERWYETYYAYAEAVLPAFYEHLANRDVVETMLVAEARASAFFDVLGEEMDLEEAGVVSASIRPEPCPTKPLPIPEIWEIALEEILKEIPLPQRCPLQPCPDPNPVFVPTLTAHLRDEDGDAIVHVDPIGTSSGVYVDLEEWCWDDPACDPFPHWWTEDGWGTVDRSGIDLDGEPIPFPA